LIDFLLPRGPSWHSQHPGWGDYDEHRLEASLENGRLAALLVRVDLRRNDVLEFAECLVGFVRAMDAVLVRVPGLLIEPDLEVLIEALKGSAAFRFVADPYAFLRRVDLGGYEDA
jgi:hypothetical protein